MAHTPIEPTTALWHVSRQLGWPRLLSAQTSPRNTTKKFYALIKFMELKSYAMVLTCVLSFKIYRCKEEN